MDWVRPQVVPWHHDHAYLDWPTHSSSDPIRWRPCADPGQKQELGDWMTQKGIDLSRPVTEAHFGLTPKKYQSGETDITGRISKIGDGSVRTALYEAAHILLTRPIKGGALKSWAMRLAKRAGMKKAKVALARKLAVVLHRMWLNATAFDYQPNRCTHAAV